MICSNVDIKSPLSIMKGRNWSYFEQTKDIKYLTTEDSIWEEGIDIEILDIEEMDVTISIPLSSDQEKRNSNNILIINSYSNSSRFFDPSMV